MKEILKILKSLASQECDTRSLWDQSCPKFIFMDPIYLIIVPLYGLVLSHCN